MSFPTSSKLGGLVTRLYKEVRRIEEERGKGNVIESLRYVVTPEEFETLMTDEVFKAMAENRFPNRPKGIPIPNIGGYEVVKDETIGKSKVDYTVITSSENRERLSKIHQTYRY